MNAHLWVAFSGAIPALIAMWSVDQLDAPVHLQLDDAQAVHTAVQAALPPPMPT